MDVIYYENINIQNINYGKPIIYNDIHNIRVINLYYKNADINQPLYIQSPLLDTFGIKSNEKYGNNTYTLQSICENKCKFIIFLDEIQNKIKNDINKVYHKIWNISDNVQFERILYKEYLWNNDYQTINYKLSKINDQWNFNTYLFDDEININENNIVENKYEMSKIICVLSIHIWICNEKIYLYPNLNKLFVKNNSDKSKVSEIHKSKFKFTNIKI